MTNVRDTASSKLAASTGVFPPPQFNSAGFIPRPISCFLCKGPHRLNGCPHKTALTALQAHILTKEFEETQEEVEEPSQMGALRFLNAVEKQPPTSQESQPKGLMFVNWSINEKVAKSVMVDTGATHNFMFDIEDQARNQPTRQHVELKTHKPKEVEEILAERVVDKFE
ncbi:hypothetical protein ACLB2K_019961 [Fragaria x ananassa]